MMRTTTLNYWHVLLFLFSIPFAGMAQLSGTYTIDAANPTAGTNYSTFADAKIALTAGVSGAVTFNVIQGTYNEQVEFGSVTGASATNTITFQADPANTNDATISFSPVSSLSSWVIGFDGASYYTIKGLVIQNTTTGSNARVIDFDNGNHHISILDNEILGVPYTGNATSRAVIYNFNSTADQTDYVTIRGNTIKYGSNGIWWSGSNASKESGTTIVDNVFEDFSQRGIWVEKQNDIRLDSNIISQSTSRHPSPIGMVLKTTDTLQVAYNSIVIKGTANAQGMQIRECYASAGSPGLIYNNMIVSSDVSTGNCFGLNVFQNANLNIYHNSVYVRSGNGTKAALFMNYNNGQVMTNITVKNNIFAATAGYALAVDPKFNSSNVLDLDHNVYFAASATPIKYIDSTYNTFADYQSNTGNDSNSVFGNPLFVSSTDLHVLGTLANDMGDNTLGITKDIDGDTRPLSPSTTVDAGADEYAPATCFPSIGFAYSNLNVSGATLSWIPDATNATHKVQFDTSGFVLGTGTVATTTSGSYNITGLMGNTTYDAYLISYCSATDSTTWAGPITFTTPCANVSSYPYTETFDGNSWVPYTTTANYQSTIDPCWSATPNPSTAGTGVVKWVVHSGSTVSFNTGPSAAYGGSGKYLYIETSNGAAWQAAKLFSKNFDLTSMTNPQLVFQLHRYGADIGRFFVFANHNGQRDTLMDVYGPDGNAWKEQVINLSAYVNDTIQLEFEARKATTFTGDIAIDNLVIEEVPACPKVTAVTFGSKTSSSVKLNITGSGQKYNVEYGPTGFAQGTGFTATVPDTNAVITGLMSQTRYDFYLQNNCVDSGDGFSTWVGPFTTRTLCGAFVAPYSNDWDHLTGQAQDFCWKSHRNGGTSGVAKSITPGPTYAMQPVSPPNIYRLTNATNPNGVFMISPEFSDLDSNVNQIRFYASQTGGSAAKHLIIGTLENRDSLNTFSLVDTIYPIRNGAMVEYVIVLNSVPSGHKHIAFFNDGSVPSIFFGIDNFNYEAIPACTAPTALNASHIEATSALITWTAGGSAGLWNVEYGPSGFTQGTGVVTGLTVAKDSLTGLLSNTCYDYYVQEDCGNNQSTWFGPYTFCTPCAVITAPYTENFGQPDFVSTTGFPYNSTMDDCWTVWPNNASSPNSYKWVVKNGSTASFSTGPSKGYGGSGQYVYTEASNSGTNAFLKTPTIDFSNLTNPTLTFYYHMYGANMGTLTVRYLHDTINDTIAVISGQQHTSDTASWTMHYVDLTSYKQMPGEIQFVGTRGSGFTSDMAIDAIKVDEAICFDPNGLGTTAIGTFTADLSWVGSSAAQEFYIEYGAQGFTQGSGIGTLDTVLTNAYQITGLSADSCYDYYVASGCGLGVTSSWVGPYTFCTLPTCPKPVNITVQNIGTVDVTFDWTTGGSNHWQYMITTGNQPNGTPVTTNIDSITVGGLSPATRYRIWVRDSCSATDISSWAGPVTFTTNCVAYTMPFMEDFSNMTNNNGLVCWDRSGGSNNWNTFVFSNPTNKLARANFYSWQAGNDAKFTSPEIFVNTNAQLKYKWTHKYWSLYPNDSMYVLSRIAGSATWDTVNVHGGPTFDNPSQTTGTVPVGTLVQETFALPANYVNNNIEIQFHAVSGYGYDVFVDDVIVELDPAFLTCLAPDTLSSSNIGVTAADVSWTSASNSNYQIMYGPGLTAAVGGIMTTSTTNSKTLSNLSPGTKYNFFVREICSPGDTSYWSTEGTFRTMCAPMQLPYSEDFDGANFPLNNNGVTFTLDSCWNREGAWPGYRFVIRPNATPTALTGPSGDVDGTGNFAYIEGSDGSSGDSASLITPLIDLSTATNPYLKYHYHFYGADIQSFYVSVDDGNGFVNVDTISGQQQTSTSAAWLSKFVDLTAFANSTSVRIKFQGERNLGVLGDMSFDQLSVFDSISTPVCVDPVNFVTSSVACDSVSFSWLSDVNTVFSTLVWDTAGFDPTLGGNLITPATSPFGIGGLTPGMSYDVYLVDSCAFGTTTPILVQFTTASAPLPVINFTYNQSNTTVTNATVDFDATGTTDGQVFVWTTNNGTNIQTGVTIQEAYAQNGNDTVHLSVMNTCGSVDTSFVINIQGIGIEDNMISRTLKVYPNPNQGKFRVSFELDGLKQVGLSVQNALGQQVYAKELGKVSGIQNEDLDISNLAKGIYVLQVNANGQRSNFRITVQ